MRRTLLLVLLLALPAVAGDKPDKKEPKAEEPLIKKLDRAAQKAGKNLREEAKKNKLIKNATDGLH